MNLFKRKIKKTVKVRARTAKDAYDIGNKKSRDWQAVQASEDMTRRTYNVVLIRRKR
jgi:hypothetical protein